MITPIDSTMKNYPKQTIELHPHSSSGYCSPEDDAFFAGETASQNSEKRANARETITHLLIWIAEGATLEQRGIRTTVMLYCLRPDLIGDATLEQIGEQADCTRQAIHGLAKDFRDTMGFDL